MNNSVAKMTIWAGADFACIKIEGRANLNSSIDFKNLMSELKRRGCPRFILELSGCPLMDSTFLGVLAGLGLRTGGDAGGNQIQLLNPNTRITGLLESLGVLHLFRIGHGPLVQPTEAEQREVTASPQSETALAATCLEAHETLMKIDPANVPKFKDVAQFMAEDLKRAQKR